MKKPMLFTLTVLLGALALTACGGGGGEGSVRSGASGPGASAAAQTGAEAKPPAQHRGRSRRHGQGAATKQGEARPAFIAPAHHDSAGGSAQFQRHGADDSIQRFGTEASAGEFKAAATAMHGYLDARADGAWGAACSYLATPTAASLAQLSGGAGGAGACPEVLASLSTGVPASSLREAAQADAGALRLEGRSAFLLFRDAQGRAYFIPMAREEGAWKVASLAPSALS